MLALNILLMLKVFFKILFVLGISAQLSAYSQSFGEPQTLTTDGEVIYLLEMDPDYILKDRLDQVDYFSDSELVSLEVSVKDGALVWAKNDSSFSCTECDIVILENLKMYVNDKTKVGNSDRRKHSSLTRGSRVVFAGMVSTSGKQVILKNHSGHYQPDTAFLVQAARLLVKKGFNSKNLEFSILMHRMIEFYSAVSYSEIDSLTQPESDKARSYRLVRNLRHYTHLYWTNLNDEEKLQLEQEVLSSNDELIIKELILVLLRRVSPELVVNKFVELNNSLAVVALIKVISENPKQFNKQTIEHVVRHSLKSEDAIIRKEILSNLKLLTYVIIPSAYKIHLNVDSLNSQEAVAVLKGIWGSTVNPYNLDEYELLLENFINGDVTGDDITQFSYYFSSAISRLKAKSNIDVDHINRLIERHNIELLRLANSKGVARAFLPKSMNKLTPFGHSVLQCIGAFSKKFDAL